MTGAVATTSVTMSPDAARWFVAAIVVVLAIRFRPQAPPRELSSAGSVRFDDSPVTIKPSHRQRGSAPRPTMQLSMLNKRRTRDGDLARWCDDLARAVRGGATLHSALRSLPAPSGSPIEQPVRDMMQGLARGQSLSDAVSEITANTQRSTHDQSNNADVSLIATVLEQCAKSGGSSAEPLERAASVLRARDAARGEVAAQSASARMSAIVLTLLPVAMLALLLATSASTREAIATPFGVVITVAGMALNLAGWRWMGRLIKAVQT